MWALGHRSGAGEATRRHISTHIGETSYRDEPVDKPVDKPWKNPGAKFGRSVGAGAGAGVGTG